MKLFWLTLVLFISSCDNTPLVNIRSEGLSDFHSEQGNWILSNKLLTEPESNVVDTFWLDAFSEHYRYFGEQPLYNEYQNAEIIRISFIQSFSNHSLLELINSDGKVQLIEKELERQMFYNKRDSSIITMGWYEFNSTYDTIHEYRRIYSMDSSITDEHFKVGEYAPLMSETIRCLSNSEWNDLVNLVNSNNFRELTPTAKHCCDDGYNLIRNFNTVDVPPYSRKSSASRMST